MAKPGLPGWYGSSWHASYRLGSAQSAVRVLAEEPLPKLAESLRGGEADVFSPLSSDGARIRIRYELEGKPLVYLDNAATTHKPWPVIKALEEFYSKHNANVHRGIHELSRRATVAYEEAREKVARFIGEQMNKFAAARAAAAEQKMQVQAVETGARVATGTAPPPPPTARRASSPGTTWTLSSR